jgi:outer membrane protein OmpA-like peptidoglycan-associated protein
MRSERDRVVPKSLGLRRRSAWWLGLLGLMGVLALFLSLRAGRRPEDVAGRETTITKAELARDQGVTVSGAAGAACSSHAGCADGALCTRAHCEPITLATTECRDARVRFARGVAELSSTADVTVERTARCLKANHTPLLAIEPSTDTRLSTEENDRLTDLRRSAVRRALEQRGVAADRLGAVGLD